VQNAWGRPEVVYSQRGELMRRRLGVGAGHVTLTDEAGLIVAVAVLESAPKTRARRRVRTKGTAPRRAKSARGRR
jgi:hypothetical protein